MLVFKGADLAKFIIVIGLALAIGCASQSLVYNGDNAVYKTSAWRSGKATFYERCMFCHQTSEKDKQFKHLYKLEDYRRLDRLITTLYDDDHIEIGSRFDSLSLDEMNELLQFLATPKRYDTAQ
ncbi:hypothetical protein [Lewinella sp. 4G2]|uniref:hypothetical protein n=1 Tax=Lewinella sp. 4G2 TaxID=1803372 RepID=UPI0007B47546|nr:hypothetical protein [Lewinella sp. 4G2]OAV43660.1 hypothetical protein A3850_003730 [Lewinella sp. 4G2]